MQPGLTSTFLTTGAPKLIAPAKQTTELQKLPLAPADCDIPEFTNRGHLIEGSAWLLLSTDKYHPLRSRAKE
jgi:hypothetical protein